MAYGDLSCSAHEIARQEREADAELEDAAQPRQFSTSNILTDDDGNYTAVMMFLFPRGWNRDRVTDWFKDQYPAQHCQHEYDCCGHTYGGAVRWEWGPSLYAEGDEALVTAVRSYRVNI